MQSLTASTVSHLVSALRLSVDTMLGVLGSCGNTGGNASFAEMGNAIDAIVGEDESGLELSSEHQLVLACVWLNLKECALTAGKIVALEGVEIRAEEAEVLGELMVNILTCCR